MNLLVHGKLASPLLTKHSALLQDWGYQVVCPKSQREVKSLCTQIDRPSILVIDLEAASEMETHLFENYDEHPLFLFIVEERMTSSSTIKALDLGAHDTLQLPLDLEVLKRKLKIAKDRVVQHEAFIETSNILERYSQHIDKVAEERARQLIHAERLSTLGIMSAGIAHEINTPIAYMSSSLEMARLYWDKLQVNFDLEKLSSRAVDEQLTKALERIPKALERIDHGLSKVVRLTTSLKNFGRSNRGERSFCSINECIREALELAEHALKPNVHVESELTENLPLVNIDPQQIEQVLINLFVNAAHAMEDQDHRLLRVSSEVHEQMIRIIVQDNGPGIPEEHLANIWNAFFTTKKVGKGTGLGLAISKGIIRDHSGSIEVTNGQEGGACFEIRIPLSVPK